jgi:hypothetical protein
MLPLDKNLKQEDTVRICNACNELMTITKDALLAGDLATVMVRSLFLGKV